MKFRVRNTQDNNWVSDPILGSDGRLVSRTGEFLDPVHHVLEFCLGIMDNTGKEIYVGDIVEYPSNTRPYSAKGKSFTARAVATFVNGSNRSETHLRMNPQMVSDPSCFNQYPRFSSDDVQGHESMYSDWSAFHRCRIIGNIHDNPELVAGDGKS